MYLSELFTWQYWLTDPGMSQTPLLKGILIFFALMIVVGLVLRIWFRKGDFHPVSRNFLKPIPGHLIRWGIVGLLLSFFRYEGAAYLSWRVWWLVFAIWVIYQVVKNIRFWRREYDKRMEQFYKSKESRKWEIKGKKKKKK